MFLFVPLVGEEDEEEGEERGVNKASRGLCLLLKKSILVFLFCALFSLFLSWFSMIHIPVPKLKPIPVVECRLPLGHYSHKLLIAEPQGGLIILGLLILP
jgi:hypothetical protein